MDIRKKLKSFSEDCPQYAGRFKDFIVKEDWNSSDRCSILSELAKLLLNPSCAQILAEHFRGILLDLLHRATAEVDSPIDGSPLSTELHEAFCLVLAQLAPLHHPTVFRFALNYFKNHPPPFYQLVENPYPDEPAAKKRKWDTNQFHNDSPRACYGFVRQSPEDFHYLWNWTSFLIYLNSSASSVKWFTSLSLALLCRFNSQQTASFLRGLLTREQIWSLAFRYEHALVQSSAAKNALPSYDANDSVSSSSSIVSSSDLMPSVVSVGNVLLPSYKGSKGGLGCLVSTTSTCANMHSLVLAVKKGLPVLLQGPIGSGKTSTVEHLAQLTGRNEQPHLLKVQLGDQTDSKMLLGTYRCTDVPGEFIWQPGTLLQAVQNGYWILLEDIDYAPMDVLSLLVPLLETRTITVPGHSNPVKASPEFHLFATQRLLGSSSGFFKAHSSHVDILDKLFTKISVQPLSPSELKEVIVNKWPILIPAIDRIVEVYLMISSGKHEFSLSNDCGFDDVAEKPSILSNGRPVSTRDLLKWCSRMSECFPTSSEKTMAAFKEALDCFCYNISKTVNRITIAKLIAAKLNIVETEAEFYCTTHKPTFQSTKRAITIGRATLYRKKGRNERLKKNRPTFAFTRQSSVLLEQMAVAVKKSEPVLIVGETGTGKTATVQYLAEETGHRLIVVNMNQHSDSADLLGGFKPVDIKFLVRPLKEEYEEMFCKTFSRAQNAEFLKNLSTCYNQKNWKDLLTCMKHTQRIACQRFRKARPSPVAGSENGDLLQKWMAIGERINRLEIQVKHSENALAFAFTEGTLVKAIKEGSWILLDEINLASAETLDCLGGLLESISGSVLLMERGDTKTVKRHPEFRLFACMNPATDVGKKELPPGLRNRFTEFYMEDLEDKSDLGVLVEHYLKGLTLAAAQLDGIVKFYLQLRVESEKKLTDGTGHKPHYSLRTLCRALSYAAGNPCMSVPRSLYEAFCLSFLTQLDRSSHPVVEELITKFILVKQNVKGILHKPLPEPSGGRHLKFEGHFILKGDQEPVISDTYVLTPSIRCNLKDLSRVVAAGRFPVLLQGGTSVGKTSLIKWLADSTGNYCVRVNNHEHTDLQEYVGSYAADLTGKLVFKEGVLVDAMKKGYWIILDELNLAPSDVLEALNRVLDDNRELFIPETQETIKAHPRFMLFATQNPPIHYGGRKVLSRAFRNRFIELHFEEIPSKELETILHERCALPPSYCKKLVAIMTELQTRRSASGIFAGKQGFITLRDLFRWAERYRLASNQSAKFYDWDQHLADEGYLLLAGRVRKPEEVKVIAAVLNKHFKCKVNADKLFSFENGSTCSPIVHALVQEIVQLSPLPSGFDHLVWTYNMRRLAILLGQALRFKEPVLLVGETGCGKTTVCQFFAALSKLPLYSINCHMHSEGADFLGGLRPVRSRSTDQESETKSGRLFEWSDGPLVKAMREGAVFLADEISLADDSVLERLNSVLEPERTLLIAENISDQSGTDNAEMTIVAKDSFRFVSTMNPGGDYGKKELSPALRNRFTEIWCPSSNSNEDLVNIIEHNVAPGLRLCALKDGNTGIGQAMLEFLIWFSNQTVGRRATLSIRDILSWVNFINTATNDSRHAALDVAAAYVHGACLVFLDAIGTGNTSHSNGGQTSAMKRECLSYLAKQIYNLTGCNLNENAFGLLQEGATAVKVLSDNFVFGLEPFFIEKGTSASEDLDGVFTLKAPTTCMNALRVLRAMQLSKPILLEGSPGVGKTSLIIALAKASGHKFVRINLSEQTDISDLFGADLPVEGGKGGEFAWRDGPLLRAIKNGEWVVLDELNLASQSVLEGLNACLDHRGEIYVPELGKTFQTPTNKMRRIFACQNPLNQGGARKGLPKSFLNRFTQVYIESLSTADLELITQAMYPQIPSSVAKSMVAFNQQVHLETVVKRMWGISGGPWEINLRDVFRWCDLLVKNQEVSNYNPGEYVRLVYADRMRMVSDKNMVLNLCQNFFGTVGIHSTCHLLSVTSEWVQVGHSVLPCSTSQFHSYTSSTSLLNGAQLYLLPRQLQNLESLMKCIEMNWMAILVGHAAVGKSSLVCLLAELCGHPLKILSMNSDMDTTELLGGFEQADLNRHLARISEEISAVLHARVNHLLINENDHKFASVRELRRSWHKYEALQKIVPKGTTKDEAAHFLEKVTMLKEVIKVLKSQPTSIANVKSLIIKLDKLEKVVKQDEAVNCGGRFEWVDSILVTAIQKGYWLFIDNVNFCSPSVLDRLNGLLEPNGVLSISERGICDGIIPTYTPHPDFRLILAMDPKNGEISRAMKNRGVEIFLGTEEMSLSMRTLELKTLLDGVGLKDPILQDMLTTIHDTISNNLVTEKPSINDLLRTAQLTVQRAQEGENISEALFESCLEVYVRCQNIIARKKAAKNIIDEVLSSVRTQVTTSDAEPVSSISVPSCLLSVKDFSFLPELARAQQDSASLFALIQLTLHDLSTEKVDCLSVYRNFMQTDAFPNKNIVFRNIVGAALKMFLLWGSCNEWSLRVNNLNYFSATCKQAFATNDSNSHVFEYFDLLVKNAAQAVEVLSSCNLASSLPKKLSALFRENELLCEETFYDLRWNPQLLKFLIHKRSNPDVNVSTLLDEMFSATDRCNLLFEFHLWKASVEDDQQKFLTQLDDKNYPKKLSLLQISLALSKGVKSSYCIPDALVQHLHPFFKALFLALDSTLAVDGPFSSECLSEWAMALHWIRKFWSICSSPIMEKSLALSDDTLLYLHWLWLTAKAFPVIFGPTWEVDKFRNQSFLWPIYDKLATYFKRHLEYVNAYASKLYQTFGHPKPYTSQLEAEICIRMNTLWQKFSVAFKQNMRDVSKIRYEIKDILLVKDFTPQIEERVVRLEEDATSLGLIRDNRNPSLEAGVEALMDSAFNVQMLALIEHLALMEEQRYMSCLMSKSADIATTTNTATSELAELSSFATPLHLATMEKLAQSGNMDNALLLQRQFDYFNSHWQCTPSESSRVNSYDQITSSNSKFQGPQILCIPQQSIMAAVIVSEVCDSTTLLRPEHIQLSADLPLRCCFEKTSQLCDLSNVIWNNAKSLNSPNYDTLINDFSLILSAFCNFLASLYLVVESSAQDTTCNVVNILRAINPRDFPQVSAVRSTIELASTVLAESELFTKELQNSWDIIKENVFTMLDTVHCVESFENRVALKQLVASTWVYLGWMQALLLAPIFDADPAIRRQLKLQFWQEEEDTVSDDLFVIDLQMHLITGRRLSSCEPTSLHPMVQDFGRRISEAGPKIKFLKADQTYRPTHSQYEELRKDMIQFVQTIGSSKTVFHLLQELTRSAGSNSGDHVLGKVQSWLASQQAFLQKILVTYPLYQDLTMPCFIGILQMMHGMTIQLHATRTKILCSRRSTQPNNIMETIKLLLGFPSYCDGQLSCFDVSRSLQSSTVTSTILSLFSPSEKDGSSKMHLLRLLKSSLLELLNHAITATYLHKDEMQFLDKLLQSVVVSWQQQEEERRRKEAEDESLYLFKGKEYGEIIDEEQQIKQSIKMTFPTYAEEFTDLVPVLSLEEPMSKTPQDNNDEENTCLNGQITQQEIEDIMSIHGKLFVNYTSCVWHHQEPENATPDFVSPFMVRYPVAADILVTFGDMQDRSIETSLLNGHLLVSSLYQNLMDTSSQNEKPSTYDFYRDSNITEAVQCRPILEDFTSRINELLREWPTHPTLLQVQKVIDRILGFSITSPLMKFVTGLELLLGQAQEWEKNAHKGVSMFNQLEAITKQIIKWRKLELRFWSSYLDFVETRAQCNASKWWFHIYTTTHNWLNPDCTQQETPQENAISSNGIQSIKEICTTLQQFMETSPLGEYKGRLEIMLAFACQLMHTDASSRQKKIISLFWNLFQYYKQFLPAVLEKITQLRKPIDKDLKNFIKIARWNDINFWAVKEAVEKSHRMLHKYIKQYENCLKQSSHTVFSDDDLLSKMERSDEPDSFPVNAKLYKQVHPSTAKDYFVNSDSEMTSTHLGQLPQLYTKAHKLCKKVLATTLFSKQSLALNEFIGDVITNVHELQALEVNKTSTKDRQRVEAKNINLRKRRALADLFRILSEIGLSYRKGQLYCQDENNQELDIALLPPLDVAVAFKVDGRQSKTNADVVKTWQDCPRYFYRSVARMAMLQLSLENPSKELGPANLHRCLGFVAHLRFLCIEQREDLAHVVNALHNFKSLTNNVAAPQLGSTSLLFPPQDELKEWIVVLLDQLAVARQGLGQFLLLLQSCPAATTNPKISAAVLDSTCEAAAVENVRQGHPWLSNALLAAEACIESVRDIQNSLNNEKPVVMAKTSQILTWQNADAVSAAFEQFQAALNAVLLPISTADNSPFIKLPCLLLEKVNDLACKFHTWKSTHLEGRHQISPDQATKAPESSSCVSKLHNKADKLVNKILLAIQEVFKKDVTSSTSANENISEEKKHIDGENGEEVQNETDLEDGALVNGLCSALKSSFKILNIADIEKRFLQLLKNWKSVTSSNLPTGDVNCCSKILLRTLPLLKLYTNLLEFYLHTAINAHRVTTKMTSVFLGVFTELVRKGFCLPAEFSDDVAGDGCTTFEDIQGGGIGEGEGMKDVSDRIENEDQLEEAHQEGTEKEQESGQQPDLKDEEHGIEMSEDFEGKMHDLDDESQKDDSSKEESDDENELEKQMGDLQGDDADKLDEKVWGDDESEDGDDSDVDDDKEDEFGQGDGPQEESKLVANTDNKPGEKGDSEEPDETEPPQDENEKEGKINVMDDREFDDRPDPYFDDKKMDGKEQEDMELPEDLNLDEEEKGEGEQDEGFEDEKLEENMEGEDADDIQENDKDESKAVSDEEGEGKEEEHPNNDETKIDDDTLNGEEKDDTKLEETNGEKDNEGEANKEEIGLEPEKEENLVEKASSSRDKPSQDDTVQPAENNAKDGSSDMVQSAHQGATDDDQANENNDPNEETSGIGQSEAENAEGHEGKKTSNVQQPQNAVNEKIQHVKDRPGQTNDKRSLGEVDQQFHKRLRTEDGTNRKQDESQEEADKGDEKEKSSSDVFQHIEKSDSHHDAQVLDAATREQALEQAVPNKDEEEAEKMEVDEDVQMLTDEDEAAANAVEEKHPLQLNPDKKKPDEDKKRGKDFVDDAKENTEQGLVEGDRVETMIVERGLETTMHTQHELLPICDGPPDVEKLRQELEEQLQLWNSARENDSSLDACDVRIEANEALEAWHKYEDVTSQLAQDLCEQLRLILEPSLTAKLRGDYRTGKRLNMRKVIPYVASQFRKDKIWLRRTKPSKREYQIMLAIDDSSSMGDNHSKQLAFEALAMINKALLLLEAGEVAIASFGETVNVLHQMGDQFSDQVGAAILREFTFQQRKTRVGLVVDHAASMMLESRENRRGGGPKALEVAQLLIIVSDGRGIFNEGMEAVKKAIRRAIESGLFIVFVALDNPLNKDSIFDIRVPVFKGPGQLPEIKSYMDDFPFPFYIILRDINSLPGILSDALRQWFELVTSTER